MDERRFGGWLKPVRLPSIYFVITAVFLWWWVVVTDLSGQLHSGLVPCLKLKKLWSLLLWLRKLERLLQQSCSWTVDLLPYRSCLIQQVCMILCHSSHSTLLLVCCRCLKELQASTPRRRLVNSPVISCAPRCRRTCLVKYNHHHHHLHHLSRTAGEVCCGGCWGRGWLGLYMQTTEVFLNCYCLGSASLSWFSYQMLLFLKYH